MKHHVLIRSLRLAVYTSLAGASARAASIETPGVPNFFKVDDRVYRGGQPTDEGFATLAKLGVKTIIDLREIGEHSQKGEEALATAQGMRYWSIPMQKRTAPAGELMGRLLNMLSD